MSTFARRWLSVSLVLCLGTGLAAQETPRSGESRTSAAAAEYPYQGEVTCENLNVRLAPKLDAATGVVAVLRQGEKVVALGDTGDFLIVQAPKKATAWISSKHVKKDVDGSGLVLVNDAPLRTDSRANAEKVGAMKEGDQVTIVKEHLGWYQISAPAGVKYYVSKKYVRFLNAVEGPKPVERIETIESGKAGGSDTLALAKMADARKLIDEQNELISRKQIKDVDFTEVVAAYKEAIELAKTEPVRKQAEDDHKRFSIIHATMTAAKIDMENADEELAKLKERLEINRRDPALKYEACGYVDTVGPLFYRPGTFKLMMSGKIIAFVRLKDGDEDMRVRMNRHYGKYVGITGSVLKDPPGWPGHQVITIESVEEIKEVKK
jgi:uncharacterized protein YgiM (DUF1202 family)